MMGVEVDQTDAHATQFYTTVYPRNGILYCSVWNCGARASD